MRRIAITFVLLMVPSLAARAADPEPPAAPPTTQQQPPAKVEEVTEVLGDFPAELAGRWLVVGDIKLGDSGRVRSVARLWEIRQGRRHLELELGRWALPTSVNVKLNVVDNEGEPWVPEPADLRAIEETWGKQPPLEANYTGIENKLAVAAAYPPEFNEDEITKGSDLAIAILENFSGAQAAKRAYSVYGVREQTDDLLKGTFLTSTFAMAPFPIPIVLKGDFRAYRIGSPPPPPAWWQRLFSGCGR